MLGLDLYLITKVRLGALFFVRQPHRNLAARNRIERKHADFVLCDAQTMQPILASGLDDSSHERKDRQKRHGFVDQVFAVAGLPILHIPATRTYQPGQLATSINEALQGGAAMPGS